MRKVLVDIYVREGDAGIARRITIQEFAKMFEIVRETHHFWGERWVLEARPDRLDEGTEKPGEE